MTRQNKQAKVRNENRPGYKKTRVGWIPEEWEEKKIGSLFSEEKSLSSDLKTFPLYSLTIEHGVTPKTEKYERGYLLKDKKSNNFKVVKPNTIVFNPMNLRFGAIALSNLDFSVCVSAYYNTIQPSPEIDPQYYIQLLKSERLKYLYNAIAIGSLIEKRRVHWSVLSKVEVPYPRIEEQKKIANILSTWDKAINQTQTLIDTKTRLKKGLMQKLLTGQLRVDEPQLSQTFLKTKIGLLPKDWQVKAFTKVFTRISKPVQVEPGKEYREIGIRSHGKGIFHKDPVSGAQLGNKRVFHVQPGTLVFNIVFAWEQAVGIFSEKENGFIASHRFPMFRADEAKCMEAFALLFFLSKRGKHGLGIASPGGAGRNKTLGQQELNHLYLPIPPIHEQKKIIQILNLCEKEITHLTNKKSALEKQKKGLMQKLLTGEIRVND